jgi:hypothetical protein
MPVRFVPVALVLGFCCGCQSDPPGAAADGPSGSRVWTRSGPDPGVAGLDSGHCFYVGKALLVWTADGKGGGGGRTTRVNGGVEGTGSVTLPNGRSANFSFQIPDERAGTVQFSDARYDLNRGRVFLVRLLHDSVVVKQVDLDLTPIDPTTADFAAVGRADPVVRAFFEERVAK